MSHPSKPEASKSWWLYWNKDTHRWEWYNPELAAEQSHVSTKDHLPYKEQVHSSSKASLLSPEEGSQNHISQIPPLDMEIGY